MEGHRQLHLHRDHRRDCDEHFAAFSVTLLGSSTALAAAGDKVLRDGDEAGDGFGNTISVSASDPLRSD